MSIMKRWYLFILYASLLMIGCKQEELKQPQSITSGAIDIQIDKATLNGEVVNEGSSAVKERGFVFSNSNSLPTINDSKVTSGMGKGIFNASISNLLVNTKYYFRSYSINDQGIAYGNTLYFLTLDFIPPTVSTGEVQNLLFYSVTLNGSIINDGGASILERGFLLKEYDGGYDGLMVRSVISIQVGSGIGDFFKSIPNLRSYTKYSYKAYAKNAKGITYGKEVTFTTLPEPDYKTVVSATGRIWLDKNLGAINVSTSISDAKSFGYLYQWGRSSDGHQVRDSPLSQSLVYAEYGLNNSFILSNSSWGDWLIVPINSLWSGLMNGGDNNVCPLGFRVPTTREWKEEIESWGSKSGYESPLKLPLAGIRDSVKGIVQGEGSIGFYWSSTPYSNLTNAYGIGFTSTGTGVEIGLAVKATGASVRCIKE